MMMFLSTMTSCSADKKSLPPNGYLYCGYCHGTGYDYYYLGGLISEECSSCGGSGYGINILQGCQHLKAVDMFMLTNIFHGMNVIYAASINCIGK